MSKNLKEATKMKKGSLKKFVKVLIPAGFIAGGTALIAYALKAAKAEDAAEAVENFGEELAEKIEENFEEVE